MSALDAVSGTYKVTVALITWFNDLKTKDENMRALEQTVVEISAIAQKFNDAAKVVQFDDQLTICFKGLHSHLTKTKEHADRWEGRVIYKIFAFLSPASVTKSLREDRRVLSQDIEQIQLAIAVLGLLDRAEEASSAKAIGGLFAEIINEEVKDFWHGYIGSKVVYVKHERFIIALKEWIRHIPDSTCTILLLQLDPYNDGVITPSELEDLASGRSLRSVIDMYISADPDDNGRSRPRDAALPTQGLHPPQQRLILEVHEPNNVDTSHPTRVPESTVKPEIFISEDPVSMIKQREGIATPAARHSLPLLVWIDDMPEENVPLLAYAYDAGITVVLIQSTAMAKYWFEQNEAYIRDHDKQSRIRIITDNVRSEATNGTQTPILNISAGENILRYLRGRCYQMPVLVYTSDVERTKYVRGFDEAGSTTSRDVVYQYLERLGKGDRKDKAWRGYAVALNTGGSGDKDPFSMVAVARALGGRAS